jgi:transcriptional regulator with XRE-family HTH domain
MLDIGKMKALREKLKLSQDEAAKKAGLSGRQRWNDIESGRRAGITLTTLDAIAKALGVKAKDLLK